ncbi:MAG: 4Fe-4S dicluster domain-containing protein [Planctomycetales bacterium]|nr:4Fe-4S dicluster domain-containing protein [Planctomycetales bacterium]
MNVHRSDNRPRLSRRELLTGKLWKLWRPPTASPTLLRYPRSRADLDVAGDQPHEPAPPPPPAPSLQGISIGPVPVRASRPVASRRTLPVFRPPGAVQEQRFLAGCTRCQACAEACPHDAIRLAAPRLDCAPGQPLLGTPVIEADVQPCLMCADFPCIAACEPQVLTHAVPKLMGTARITEHLCSAYHGTACNVCSEQCPVAHAIEVVDGRPRIREEACTGCGLCRFVCPAPENAILLMPTFSRPTAVSSPEPRI